MINKQKKWSDCEIKYLINNYSKTSTEEIMKKLNRSLDSVKIKANRLGLKKPSHSQDNNYFDVIDTSEKAYWLGFIAADGYVVHNTKSRNYELGIEISIKDIEHLRMFASTIKTDQEVRSRKKSPFAKARRDKECEMCFLRLYSKRLVESLEKYNIIQNKTYNMVFPHIEDKYIWDYIRGYFDGDGCVFSKRVPSTNGGIHTYQSVSFACKCYGYLKRLGEILSNYGIESTLTRDRSCYVLYIRRQKCVMRFFSFIYSRDDCVRLERKYNRYKEFYQYKQLPA